MTFFLYIAAVSEGERSCDTTINSPLSSSRPIRLSLPNKFLRILFPTSLISLILSRKYSSLRFANTSTYLLITPEKTYPTTSLSFFIREITSSINIRSSKTKRWASKISACSTPISLAIVSCISKISFLVLIKASSKRTISLAISSSEILSGATSKSSFP